MAFNLFKKKGRDADDNAADNAAADHGSVDAGELNAAAAGLNVEPDAEHDVDVEAAEADADESKGGLFSRKRSGKKAKRRNENETLASVLTESEPGAAIDVMRGVGNFIIPTEIIPSGGYLVMVLPTADKSFGGLSRKQNKNEDKGLIINLMQAGDIEIAITKDLLDDDALAIIPEEGTLERLNEFSLLRDARYFWGVAVADPDTGELMIYTVPPKRVEDTTGKLYEAVAAVSRGALDIVDVVDMALVKAMYEIFMHDDPGYGAAGLIGTPEQAGAIELVLETMAVRQGEGAMPSTEDYLEVLYYNFPLINPNHSEIEDQDEEDADVDDEDAGYSRHAAVGESAALSDETLTDIPVVGANENNAEDTDTDKEHAADDEGDSELDGGAGAGSTRLSGGTDGADDVAVGEPAVDDANAGVGVNVTDDAAEADAETAVQSRVGNVSTPVPQGLSLAEQQEMFKQVVDDLRADMSAQNLSDEDVNRIVMTQIQAMQQMGLVGVNQQGQGAAANTVQSRVSEQLSVMGEDENLDEALKRSFIDDDLGLSLNMAAFEQTFYGQVPQLTFSPYESHTPWLNDQLAELVNTLNSELAENYMRRREVMRDKYRQMMSASIKDIVEKVSVNDDTSVYSQLQRAADHDRATYERNRDYRVADRRNELQQRYDADRRTYIEMRTAELGAEFDRANRQDLEHAQRMVESDLQAQSERAHHAMVSEINRKRREDAQTRLKLGEFQILNMMNPDLESMLEEEAADLANAVDVVKDYVADKAKDDIMHADAINARLAQDNRVEEIRKDAEGQVTAARQRADEEVARTTQAMELLRDEHEKFVADLKRDNEQRLAHADDRVAAVQAERTADRAHLDTMLERAEEEKEAAIKAAQNEVAQMRANMEAMSKEQKSDYTTIIIMMVVLSIVMLVAGVVLANAFG